MRTVGPVKDLYEKIANISDGFVHSAQLLANNDCSWNDLLFSNENNHLLEDLINLKIPAIKARQIVKFVQDQTNQ